MREHLVYGQDFVDDPPKLSGFLLPSAARCYPVCRKSFDVVCHDSNSGSVIETAERADDDQKEPHSVELGVAKHGHAS